MTNRGLILVHYRHEAMQEMSTVSHVLGARAKALQGRDQPVQSIAVGDELVMVQTGPETAGVAMYPDEARPDLPVDSAVESVRQAATTAEPHERAVGVAALNAIDPPASVRPGLDPFRRLDPAVDRVAMVGLFAPVLKRLEAGTVDVFERNPDTMSLPADLPPDLDVRMHRPAAASAVVPEAAVLYITGSTLVYGGLGTYLGAASSDQPVVLVGASASFNPDPLFEAGVSMVAGASVADPNHVREAITAGDSEADLHDGGLEKWATVDPDLTEVPGLDLA